MTTNAFPEHIVATYQTLRIGRAALALALPFILWIGDWCAPTWRSSSR